jgi:antitoxin HigA-1
VEKGKLSYDSFEKGVSMREPTMPGEILLEEFLKPKGMTQAKLAELMGVSVKRINLIIVGKRGITAETAVLLGQVFKVSAEFWMLLQTTYDLYKARLKLKLT